MTYSMGVMKWKFKFMLCHVSVINTAFWKTGKAKECRQESQEKINCKKLMNLKRCTSLSLSSRYPSGLWGIHVVSLGFVQGQVWRLRCAAPHSLHPHASCQQWSSLPPVGGREEMFPRQLLMTRPGKEGEKGEEREEGEKRKERQERKEGTKKEKQQ